MTEPADDPNLTDQQRQRLKYAKDHLLRLTTAQLCLLGFGLEGRGPVTIKQLEDLRRYILTRYNFEDALKYADNANNRVLNKARGLITFNGLTLAVFGTMIKQQTSPTVVDKCLALAGIILALLSAVILLWKHFLVDFGPKLSDYAKTETEFDSYVIQVVSRIKWISITGFVSILSLLPLLMLVVRVLWW